MAARKQQDGGDVLEVFQRLSTAAEDYVNRSPKVKRLEAQRSALLDAIANAQLILSVQRLPKETARPSAAKADRTDNTARLQAQLKTSQAKLNGLDRRLRPLTVELDDLSSRLQNLKASLEDALPQSLEDRAA